MAFVSRATAKSYLQISHAADDDLIDILLEAAQDFVAREAALYLYDGVITTTAVSEDLDGGCVSLRPTKLPVLGLTSVLDVENSLVEEEDAKFTSHRILRATDDSVWASGIKRWRANYSAGYGADDFPDALKGVILDLVFRAYYGRGGKSRQSAAGHGFDFQALMDSDMLRRLRAHSQKLGIG